ncbi:hypothetical protein ACFLSQ_06810 [Bacteroidota bacterium]
MKKIQLLFAVLILSSITIISDGMSNEVKSHNKINYDICEFFLDSKPIISYDNMFGSEINSLAFFVTDRKQPCMNYEYYFNDNGKVVKKKISHIYSGIEIVREYSYNDSGLISKVREKRGNFCKRLMFLYDKKLGLTEIIEEIVSGTDEDLFEKYNSLNYKINKKGNIYEVRGIRHKLLGLITSADILKAYEYDEMNRLKAIRDFMNPEESRIFKYEDYVRKD